MASSTDGGTGVYDLFDFDLSGGEASLASSTVANTDDQLLFTFISTSTLPNTLEAGGIITLHAHLEETGSNANSQIYFTMATTSGAVILTSEVSDIITAKVSVRIHKTIISDVEINSATDRLVFKIYANVGSGPPGQMTIYFEGTTASRFTIPAPTSVLISGLLKANGTTPLTGNWAVGGFDITNIGIVSTSLITVTATSTLNNAVIGTNFIIDSSGNLVTSGNVTLSGDFDYASTTNWDVTYGLVNVGSSNWDSAYTTVNASSTGWNYAWGWATSSETLLNSSSTNYDLAYLYGSAYNTSSTNYNVTYNLVNVGNSNWDSAYTGWNASSTEWSKAWDWATSSTALLTASSSNWDLAYLYGYTYNSSSTNYNVAYSLVTIGNTNWDAAYAGWNASNTEWDIAYNERGSQMGGDYLTFSADLDVDAEVVERTASINFFDATTTAKEQPYFSVRNAVTLLRISCSSVGGSTTVNMLERDADIPYTGGTTTLSASLICFENRTASSTSFGDSGIAAGGLIVASTTGITGIEGNVNTFIHIDFKVND